MDLNGSADALSMVCAGAALAFGAAAAGFFAALGGRGREAPNRISLQQEAWLTARASLVAVAAYTACYLALAATEQPNLSSTSAQAVRAVIALALLFVFTAHPAYLARVTREPRTLKAGVWASLSVFAGYVVQVVLATRGMGCLAKFAPLDIATALLALDLLALVSAGPTVILAELAQLWMERVPLAHADA
ncbi:MAG TPA: hypothetical protein VF665_13660 [Longimicrobium sp.]|jgi:hypothetical protein|uniref:hypothetical protein n=1 Tax=Longimicrobium sp. TaxID=2029185 RepID=UPI002EDADCCC